MREVVQWRGWLLFLAITLLISYLVHWPVHGSLANAAIPALVPWAIGAVVATWAMVTRRRLGVAGLIFVAAGLFFVIPHLLPHG